MNRLLFCLLFANVVVLKALGQGDDSFLAPLYAKAENKEITRWTLLGWIQNEEQPQLFDQWVALKNPANSYEFFVGLGISSHEFVHRHLPTDRMAQLSAAQTSGRFRMGGYLGIFGLEAEYEGGGDGGDTDAGEYSALSANFNFMFLGNAVQNTHIALIFGTRFIKFDESREEYVTLFPGILLVLYITKFFAIRTMYRKYAEAEEVTIKTKLEGHRLEAGGSYDFSFFNVYGTWFEESLRIATDALIHTHKNRQGVELGARVFF